MIQLVKLTTVLENLGALYHIEDGTFFSPGNYVVAI